MRNPIQGSPGKRDICQVFCPNLPGPARGNLAEGARSRCQHGRIEAEDKGGEHHSSSLGSPAFRPMATPETGGPTTLAVISDARRALAEAATLPDIRKVIEAASVAAGAGRRAAHRARPAGARRG